MAISSIGYPGTVNAPQAAKRSAHVGTLAPVVTGGADSFKAEANPAADRTVTVLPGTAAGFDIHDTSDAPISVQLDSISTGFRWDAVVLRRDWQANSGAGKTDVVKVTNLQLNSEALPNNLQNTPGVITDQLLCRSRVTAGQTVPFLVDARVRASKILTVPDLLAIPFPELGMVAELNNGIRFRYALDASNNPAWLKLRGAVTKLTGSGAFISEAGWTGGGQVIQEVITDTAVHYTIEVRRSGSRIIPTASGSISDQKIGTIVGEPPAVKEPFSFIYYGGAGATDFGSYGGFGEARPDGGLWIMSLAPNAAINTRPAPGTSLRARVTYARTGL